MDEEPPLTFAYRGHAIWRSKFRSILTATALATLVSSSALSSASGADDEHPWQLAARVGVVRGSAELPGLSANDALTSHVADMAGFLPTLSLEAGRALSDAVSLRLLYEHTFLLLEATDNGQLDADRRHGSLDVVGYTFALIPKPLASPAVELQIGQAFRRYSYGARSPNVDTTITARGFDVARGGVGLSWASSGDRLRWSVMGRVSFGTLSGFGSTPGCAPGARAGLCGNISSNVVTTFGLDLTLRFSL